MSILGQTAPEDTHTLCTAFMFYKQRLASPLTVDFHFVVVRDSEPILQVCVLYVFYYVIIYRVYNEKIGDSHRFSGVASRCVEWFDPNIERTNRSAKSFLFAGKIIKHDNWAELANRM